MINSMFGLDDYNYELPAELIAQYPLVERDRSRLLLLNRQTGSREHRLFADLDQFLEPQDVLVINNTAVVALMTPYVYNYGRKNNIAPSKLLIPLSYATIMGGMLTLIGTSTTLVLNGFITEAGLHEIRFNDLIFIGSAVTITGIAFIVFIGYKLLPNHIDTLQDF